MSKELNVLLQHIHPDSSILKPSEKVPEPSRYLLKLVNRVENRRWLAEEIVATKQRLKEIRNELRFTKHAPQCWQCLMEMQLDIERYGGSHSGLWFLDLSNEMCFDDDDELWETLPEYYRECPRIKNYKFGSYWTGSSDDTIRFIKDRLMWAQKVLDTEVKVVRKYINALKKWDLESPLPPDSYIYANSD